MKEDIAIYGPEWIILELIAKGDEKEKILDILKNYDVCWGELLEQSISHKIISQFAYIMLQDELCNYIPPYINQFLKITLDLNRHKNKILKEQGWKVIRLWGKDIQKNLDKCINKIEKEIGVL